MCFVTWTGVAAAAAIASAGVGAVGAVSAGEAQAAAAAQQARMSAYQAQVARNNAIIANQQADASIAAGQRAAEAESMKTASRVAHLRAGFAARGVDVGSTSAVDVQSSERAVGELDAETALSNAQQRAYGYRTRASGYEAESDLLRAQEGNYYASGTAARTGSYLKAGATLLSGASQLPAGWFTGGGFTPGAYTGTSGGGSASP